MRLAAAQINPTVGSLRENQQKILSFIAQAKKEGVDLVVFPELALCGYPPEDLLLLPSFIKAVQEHLPPIIEASAGIAVILGMVRENPSKEGKPLFNTSALLEGGELLGFVDKTLLPDYDVFSERRYFEPASKVQVWSLKKVPIAVTLCEDMWQHAQAVGYCNYLKDPILDLKEQAPKLVINLSSSPFALGRTQERIEVCKQVVATLKCPLLLCNQVGGNDSLIFDGYSLALNEQQELIALGKGFQEDLMVVDLDKNTPLTFTPDPIAELYKALVLGVKDYFFKLGFKMGCLGLSGGIDSAVVAAIAKEALGHENVLALALTSRYSSEGSLNDAQKLALNLQIPFEELSIESPFKSFLNLLAPSFAGKEPDVTEENLQARIRGILLMAFSNKMGYLVLSTGNKSEMAMGYTTLYGDMCGGLAVLSDVSKELVYALARYINRKKEIIPQTIIDKPPSAELNFDQKDSDTLPEYNIVDKVLTGYVEEHLSPQEIAQKEDLPLKLVSELVSKIHKNEYKRRQAPPGLRVTKRAFTFGRRFPIVQHWHQ